jgi:hypothetical protein
MAPTGRRSGQRERVSALDFGQQRCACGQQAVVPAAALLQKIWL